MDKSINKLNKLLPMEIVDFRTQTFGEIPTQDNPAYDVHECVLICKAEDEQTGLYVVAKIEDNHKNKDEVQQHEVQQLGLFWNIDMALLFAKTIPSDWKPEKIEGGKTWSTILPHEFPLT